MSFFDLKGDVESLLHVFEHSSVYYDAHTAEYFHPGRSARAVMDGTTVAQFGQILPEIAGARKLRQDVFVGEIYLDRLYRHELRQVRYEASPRYPAVERDFSFVFADAVRFEQIAQVVAGLGAKELRGLFRWRFFAGGRCGGKVFDLVAGDVSVGRADFEGRGSGGVVGGHR